MPKNRSNIRNISNAKSSLHNIDDKEMNDLVYQCGEGEHLALKRFFSIFSKEIYEFPLKIFHLDEDSASEYFIYAYERLKDGQRLRSFQGKSSFRSWFFSVLRNLVIDWLRTRKEVTITDNNPEGDDETNIHQIDDPIDIRQLKTENLIADISTQFRERLKELDMEFRIYIKLCFIYYLELDIEELEYIKQKGNKSIENIMLFVSSLRSTLAKREQSNLKYKEKIVTLYNSIVKFKERRTRILGKINDLYNSGASGKKTEILDLNSRLLELDQKIQKKYSTRSELLDKGLKGVYMVKTPHKYISKLLKEPEGTVSVRIMKAMDKLKNTMSDLVEVLPLKSD